MKASIPLIILSSLTLTTLVEASVDPMVNKYSISEHTDSMTDETHMETKPERRKAYIGMRCDNNRNLMLTFRTLEPIATPNSKVKLMIRVDKNKPHTLLGQTYSDSYNAGFSSSISPSIYEQMATGYKLIARLYNGNVLKDEFDHSLDGSYLGIRKVLEACGNGLGSETIPLVAQKIETENFRASQLEPLCIKKYVEPTGLYQPNMTMEDIKSLVASRQLGTFHEGSINSCLVLGPYFDK